MRIRCFVAVDVEDGELVSHIVRLQRDLTETGARLKLIEPENLHVTLAFIGEVPPPLVERAKAALSKVSFPRFRVSFAGVGAFPNPGRPRVVWIGVREGREELTELARLVRARLREENVPFDKKEFVPHLTVARVKGGGGALAGVLKKLQAFSAGNMTVTTVRLKKSTLTPRGPIYETLYERELE